MKSFFFTTVFTLLFFTSLSAQDAKEDLRIFPNPVNTAFEIGPSDRVATIRVINMVGREIRTFEYAAGQLYDVADLLPGMYLVQLQGKDEKVIHTQRIKKN
ncbi:MAG: T9SS type A sorting domain-containing protein [Bacteroidota bacterium]